MSAILHLIDPKPRDLGDGFMVRRALPAIEQRMVGPFVFLDQMGPSALPPGKGLDVRPHPHIGLATVTYLFEGEIVHRDSLGFVQPIRPGDVNWMTAGRGIAHSERTSPELRKTGHNISGIQLWVGLPEADEETEPSFHHHPVATLPRFKESDADIRLIVGDLFGQRSPAKTFSPMFYADVRLPAGKKLALTAEHEERGIFVSAGDVSIGGTKIAPGKLATFTPKETVTIDAESDARFMILGGTSIGPRHLWWNFVSSSKERIEQAKADWLNRRFKLVPGETEFIPLPP